MAVAILGMRGSGNFAISDERPKNYREMLMLLFPNGDAPLTAILSMLRSEAVDDAEFRWLEKGLPVQRAAVVGATLAAGAPADNDDVAINGARPDTVRITVKPDGGSAYDQAWLKVGHALMVERTGEILFVKSKVTGSPSYIECERDMGQRWASGAEPTIVGDAAGGGDYLTIVGSGFHEGSAIGTAIAYAPLSHFNFTQIFRTPLFLTRTARKTRLRWDRTGPWIEARREALQIHATEMEKAFMFGERAQLTAFNEAPDSPFDVGLGAGQPLRLTRGIVGWLPTATTTGTSIHMDIATQFNGVLSELTFEGWCEELFRHGDNEKLLLCGSTFLNVLNQLAKNKMTITAVPTDQTYGMAVNRLITPFGNLILKQHPLMSHNPSWRKDGIAIDVSKLNYRYVDDTTFLINRQNPGDDASKDEYLTEAGLEMHFSGATSDAGIGSGLAVGAGPAAHGRLKGVAQYGG